MKKSLATALAVVTLAALFGCGKSKEQAFEECLPQSKKFAYQLEVDSNRMECMKTKGYEYDENGSQVNKNSYN